MSIRTMAGPPVKWVYLVQTICVLLLFSVIPIPYKSSPIFSATVFRHLKYVTKNAFMFVEDLFG